MSTETLDRLYLEWSNFTSAKTGKELALEARLAELESFEGARAQLHAIAHRERFYCMTKARGETIVTDEDCWEGAGDE